MLLSHELCLSRGEMHTQNAIQDSKSSFKSVTSRDSMTNKSCPSTSSAVFVMVGHTIVFTEPYPVIPVEPSFADRSLVKRSAFAFV